jgi:acyl-CoA synthetase (AMP-forming)/AMP-acid ligase II
VGEGIHAIVVRRPGAEASAEELIEHVGTRLAASKKPQSVEFVEFVDELPLGGTGKVLKRLLRDERTR